MKGFSQTECGAGTSLALSHIFGAMRLFKKLASFIRNNDRKSDELLGICLA